MNEFFQGHNLPSADFPDGYRWISWKQAVDMKTGIKQWREKRGKNGTIDS